MRQLLLGRRTGLNVSALALGTGRLGITRDGGYDPDSAVSTIRAFADAGGTFLDTSSVYLGGKAEEAIGAAVEGSLREQVVIASKFGRTALGAAATGLQVGNHRRVIQAEVEASLRRLRTDRIDVYLAHYDDGVTPIAEIMRGLDDLVRSGKVLHVGLSNFSVWRTSSASLLADLRGWAPLAVLQLHYNLLERSIEREFLPFAAATGSGIMAWSPLAGGLLGGAKSLRDQVHPLSSEGMVIKDDQAQSVIDTVKRIAEDLGTTPASVAVAWLLSKRVVGVIGPRNAEQLASNLTALDVYLDAVQLAELDRVSARSPGYPYAMSEATWAEAGLEGAGSIL